MSDPKVTASVLAELRRKRPGLPAKLLAVVAAAAAGIGALVGPSTVGPNDLGSVTHWGGWALETAFLGSVLVASVVTFRVVEILFRAQDAHALRMLPLSGPAVARDRFGLALRESLLGAAGVFCFVSVPLAGSPPAYGVVTAAYLFCAALVVPLAGFGVIVSAMSATVDPTTLAAKLTGGTVNGRGAVHHLSPGAAFGTIAGLLLLLKLGFEEPLRVFAEAGEASTTNAMFVGVGIPLCLAVATLIVGLLGFGKNFHEIQASLFDAEVPPPDTGYDYFANAEGPGRVQRSLRPIVAAFYRKDSLQASRSAPFLFPSTIVIAVIGGFALWASDFVAPFGVGMLLGFWLLLIVAPLRRIRRLPGEVDFGLADMLGSNEDREAARQAAAILLAARHTGPLLIACVGAGAGAAGAATPVAAALLATVFMSSQRAGSKSAFVLYGALALAGSALLGEPLFIGALAAAYLGVAYLLFRFRILSAGTPEAR